MLIELLLELDRIANWILGGDRRETISSRMARNIHKDPWAYWGCKLLEVLLIDKDHCKEAKQDLDNLKTNDHPLIFAFSTTGIAVALYYVVLQIADKIS